jgi:hypothetical protein
MLRPVAAVLVALLPASALTQPADPALDKTEYLRVDHDATGRFGVTVVAGPEAGKRLTYGASGNTNNTAMSVNGVTFVLNTVPPTGPAVEKKEDEGRSWTTEWNLPGPKVTVTQQVTLVRGPQTQKLDTVLVKYTVRSTAKVKQKVGLRFMLDTLIGNNDGVPFAIPEKADLVTTGAVTSARTKDLPEYVQALENPNFVNPGAVAHLGVRVSPHLGVVELPDRVILSHWPGGNAPWAYAITPMGTDSAIGLYWDEAPMSPGAERALGFTYGLTKLVSAGSGGEIGLTAGGSFKSGGVVTITAYLDRRVKQPTATLTLDPGLKLAAGQKAKQTATVRPTDPYSRITWKVVCGEPGQYNAKVQLANGLFEELPITVK